MAKEDEKLTIGRAELQALIDASVRAGVAEAQAKGAVEATDFDKAMKQVRGADRPSDLITHEECVSPLTGASFKAKIQTSRTSNQGRVIDLVDYVWPEGIDVPQSQGGLMPDAHISAPPATHAHWKYWEFLLRDMNEFASGKLFTRYITKAEHDRRKTLDGKAA